MADDEGRIPAASSSKNHPSLPRSHAKIFRNQRNTLQTKLRQKRLWNIADPPPTIFHKNPSFELVPLLPIMIMTIIIVIMNLSIEMVEHDMGRLLQQSRVRLVTHVPVQHHLQMVTVNHGPR